MKRYEATENNAGGLSLLVFGDSGKLEYVHTGYEFNPGQLTGDIIALRTGSVPLEDWDGNLLDEPEAETMTDEDILADFGGDAGVVVADNTGIYPGRMGRAAKIEFKQDKSISDYPLFDVLMDINNNRRDTEREIKNGSTVYSVNDYIDFQLNAMDDLSREETLEQWGTEDVEELRLRLTYPENAPSGGIWGTLRVFKGIPYIYEWVG